MRSAITGTVVLTDAAVDPRVPAAFSTPAGETGQIDLTVQTQAGAAYDLTGAQALLTVKYGTGVVITRQAVINSPPTAGTCYFPLVVADTIALAGTTKTFCTFDIWVTDASGNRYQVVPASSTFTINPAWGVPGQVVTVPSIQTPLGQGPSGMGMGIVNVSTTATATALFYHRCNPSTSSFTLTLPLAASVLGTSNLIAVKHVAYSSTNVVTLAPSGADTIDGFSSYVLNAGEGRLWIATAIGWESL